jgi:hypothetical protein
MSLGREIAKAFGDPDAIANDDYTTVAFGIPRAKSKLYMTLKKEYVLLLHLVRKFPLFLFPGWHDWQISIPLLNGSELPGHSKEGLKLAKLLL